jgi:TatD DNase family protein
VLVDTHCHLDRRNFPDGPDDALARARDAGVGRFVVVGVDRDLGAARDAVALAERRDDVNAVVGVHPHDASALDDAMAAELLELARHPRVVAVGEIGLDYHYLHSPAEVQRDVFRRLVRLARDVGKPIVIHTREAAAETLQILEEEGASEVGGIIHCFSEDRAFAERALALDFDLSFSGILTFKNARAIHEVAAWAPADRVLVETDSPYLAPTPMRGRPCEPAYVAHTARRMAELRGVSFEDIAAKTTENAIRRLKLSPLA